MKLFKGEGALVKAWTDGVELDDRALQQIQNVASMPFVHRHVAVMPDAHYGIGATVGTVIATKRAIVPAAVGKDIGCGMRAVKTNLTASDLPDDLKCVRSLIERDVPHGRTDNGGANDRGAWRNPPQGLGALSAELEEIAKKHPKLERATRRAPNHAGTLGTGNHFIELCVDENQDVWIMLHSGSRGVGNAIGSYFIERAKREMERWFVALPDPDLAYLPEGTELFDDYVQAVGWAQSYAKENRQRMMRATLCAVAEALGKVVVVEDSVVDCHHNYVEREYHFGENVFVTRKGAVRARVGDRGIIPSNMGDMSYIVRGKGDPESFCSCSHGAGRVMSRAEARRTFTLLDHELATQGVECRKDEGVLDETPRAYKSIDAVMEAQKDLVQIEHRLKQVVCVKG